MDLDKHLLITKYSDKLKLFKYGFIEQSLLKYQPNLKILLRSFTFEGQF